ncbi:vacuolar cation/proton exchanger 1c-like [Panicum miliaceum]|uniref:Vacuolar cation/proton exchanger n=1 Tax=Panicum miliaceum TaxID=4540 RepID=A0A3L6QH37_PANMI|nr:vacuolar cation/proton exchanger 1c-like [Panicum miliaceum]
MAPPQSGDGGAAAGDLLETGLLAAAAAGAFKEEPGRATSTLFPLFSAVPLAVAAQLLRLGRLRFVVMSRMRGHVDGRRGEGGQQLPLSPRTDDTLLARDRYTSSLHATRHRRDRAGGILNATCGNVPELIIALFALHKEKMEILKWSLLGSILSNLLLVLGSSLLCGGLANMGKERPLDRRQADVSIGLLMLGVLCHILPLLSKYTNRTGDSISSSGSVLELSRLSAIVMLTAYFGGLIFQLKIHRQIFEQEDNSESTNNDDDGSSVIGFASAVIWLIGMTVVIAVLSNYIVTTIEEASESLGIPLRFISIILLPIVGNAAEHAGAIIFAFKNKIDITLGIALGSATQISLLVVPIILIVSWVNGIPMDLDLNLLETGSLVMTVFTTAFMLQDDKWHYLKGFNLTLCYIVIAVCFFTIKALPSTPKHFKDHSSSKCVWSERRFDGDDPTKDP